MSKNPVESGGPGPCRGVWPVDAQSKAQLTVSSIRALDRAGQPTANDPTVPETPSFPAANNYTSLVSLS